MYFNRPEFDRYARFNSWGSARETFSWDEMCDIDIDLPEVKVQKKYVDIYSAMLSNQQSYERGLEDLKLLCDAYIENLRKRIPCKKIGPFLTRHDVRNGPNGTQNVMGISTSKEFRIPTSKVNRDELSNYKVVRPRQIGFVQITHTNDDSLRKMLYLASKKIVEHWTARCRNWDQVLNQLDIMFSEQKVG